jgi:superfamily II DNA or RNA helicase
MVADECHRYGSAGNAVALNEIFVRRLGLSATYARSDDGNTNHLDPYFGGTCYQMTYRQAIADEVTAHFKVALVAVRFIGNERAAYDEANSMASKARRWLVEQRLVRGEPFGEFMKDVKALAAGREGQPSWKAGMYLKAFTERRRILAESPAKPAKLRELLPAIRVADRTIVFTQTIEAAEDAALVVRSGAITAQAIHSQLDAAARRSTLGRFAQGKLAVIVAPQVLDEGVDVPAADMAIILAASRTRRQMIQRMGRVLRRKADGRLARFAILYIEGTSEDPAQGAHGDFLEEVTDVADQVRSFGATASAGQLREFLGEFRAGQPQPPARMAGTLKTQHISSNVAIGTKTHLKAIVPSVTAVGTAGGVKPPRHMRDVLAALQMGVSVERLLALRQEQAFRDRRLSALAKSLGISVKELRHRGLDVGP